MIPALNRWPNPPGVQELEVPIVPVDVSELADWLALTDTPAMLNTMLATATSMAIKFMASAIVRQKYRMTMDALPKELPRMGGLAQTGGRVAPWVDLHYTRLLAIDEVARRSVPSGAETVLVAGTDYEVDTTSNPGRVMLKSAPGEFFGALRIDYFAGFRDTVENWESDLDSGDYSYVPAPIRQGILQHAAYVYEHRGQCDADEALKKSGAAGLYGPYRVRWGL